MAKRILALYLASLVVTLGLTLLPVLSSATHHRAAVDVHIRSSADVHDLVAAINSVHRNDVELHTYKDDEPGESKPIWAAPMIAIGLFVITAIVLAIYQRICKWMGLGPEI